MRRIVTDLTVGYTRVKRYLQDHHKAVDRPGFEKLRFRFYDRLWRDTVAEMGGEIEDFGHGYLKITWNGDSTFVLESKVALDDHLSLRMAGNKPLVHRLLSERNYPIQDYQEYNIHDLGPAAAFIKKVGGACVVKPAAASGAGNGITTKIRSHRELRKASTWAATFSPRLLIEEEIRGDSYRVLFLNGEYLDTVQRNSPVVVGDGRKSIKKLMLADNHRRLNGGKIIALSPLIVDYEAYLCLKARRIRLSDVPPAGEKLLLKTVVNQNTAAENLSVKDDVHSSIIEQGREIARLFKLQLVGVDLITPDVARPLREVNGVINEINTNPGLHHHYLIDNPDRGVPVARKILEFILRNRKK